MIGFRSAGRLLANIVVDLAEQVMVRTLFSTTSDVDLVINGVFGTPIEIISLL
jgi:hypothetical protein